jgi:hypothetical protein
MFIQLKKHLVSWLVLVGVWALALPATAQGPTPADPTSASSIPTDQITTTRTDGGALVFHHLKRYQPAVAALDKESPALLRRMEAGLGLDEIPTIDVWVLPTVHDYFELNDKPVRAPKWAVGLSFSGEHEIIVAHGGQRAPGEVMNTFAHELAHVAVDFARSSGARSRGAGGPHPVPRWFHEGFAVMMAQEWTPERSENLARAAASGTLTPFEELWNSFPSHHQSASLAYDQSFHFVRWLQNQFGDDLFARVMRQMDSSTEISKSDRFEAALEDQTGTPFGQLEGRWRESLSESTTIWSILRDDLVIFFGAGVLFLITYLVVRRRRRRQFASMEDDEADEWNYDTSRYPLPGDEASD